MPSRPLLSWLFALTLLFGHAAAFAHELTHLDTHDTGMPDKVCKVCLTHAHLGTALPPSLVVLAIPPGEHAQVSGTGVRYADLAPRTACARAPPALSST